MTATRPRLRRRPPPRRSRSRPRRTHECECTTTTLPVTTTTHPRCECSRPRPPVPTTTTSTTRRAGDDHERPSTSWARRRSYTTTSTTQPKHDTPSTVKHAAARSRPDDHADADHRSPSAHREQHDLPGDLRWALHRRRCGTRPAQAQRLVTSVGSRSASCNERSTGRIPPAGRANSFNRFRRGFVYARFVATRRRRQQNRSQLGEMLLVGRVGSAGPDAGRVPDPHRGPNSQASANSLWPTWWMLIPLAFAIVGAVLVFVPESFDLRRSLLHSRFVTRLRGRS